MRISPFLLFSSSLSSPIQFLDFWRGTDVFALQIEKAFPSVEAGQSFWSEYSKVRGTMEFYQNEGDCDYFFQNPSFEEVTVSEFDGDLSIAENTKNLIDMIDAWLNLEFENSENSEFRAR